MSNKILKMWYSEKHKGKKKSKQEKKTLNHSENVVAILYVF